MDWRVKTYYEPRVLIEVADVLDSPFPDSLMCLTGAEQNLLRNLCQYLHRTATFVSQYRETDYLAPTEEEWDALQAIVATMEEKLMGCPELTQLLEDIKAAAQCACDQLTAMPKEAWPAGGILDGQRDYDDYQSDVEYGVGDPPLGFPDWDTWKDYKCKAAQKIVDDLTDLGERMEVWYSAGAAITFAAFQSFVLATAVAPPVALALGIIGILATAGTALAMIAFQQWLVSNKQDLVCLIHGADTVVQARAGIFDYIEENWDLVLGDAFAQNLFSWDVLSKAFDGGIDVSGYGAQYCAPCDIVYGTEHSWAFPPDTDWTFEGVDGYYDGEGRLYLANLSKAFSPPLMIPPATYDIDLYMTGCDSGAGYKVDCVVQGSNDLLEWTDFGPFWSTNFPVCPTSGAWGPTWDDVVWPWQYARYKIQAYAGSYCKHYTFEGAWVSV